MCDSLRPHGLVAHQAPRSVGFSRLEYWSGLPFPSPRESKGEPLSHLLSAHISCFKSIKEAVRVKDLSKGEGKLWWRGAGSSELMKERERYRRRGKTAVGFHLYLV